MGIHVQVWLAVAAVLHGEAHALPLGPDLAALGQGTSHRLIRAASLIPIILTADSCHQAVNPVMALLQPYRCVHRAHVCGVMGQGSSFGQPHNDPNAVWRMPSQSPGLSDKGMEASDQSACGLKNCSWWA